MSRTRRLEKFDPDELVSPVWILITDGFIRVGMGASLMYREEDWRNLERFFVVQQLHVVYWLLCILFRGSFVKRNAPDKVFVLPYVFFVVFKAIATVMLSIKDILSYNKDDISLMVLLYSMYWFFYDMVFICIPVFRAKSVTMDLSSGAKHSRVHLEALPPTSSFPTEYQGQNGRML